MLTLGYETFGLSMLVFPKQTLAAYCGLRIRVHLSQDPRESGSCKA